MVYFLFFISELILLLFLSKKLIHSLAQVLFRFTRSHRAVVHILAIVFLPGTIIHELAHLLFAGVMMVPVGELSVMPEIEERGVKLGSVQIGKTDPFRRMIIGVAPVFLGIILLSSVFLLIQIGKEGTAWWLTSIAFYLAFEIGNTMFSSKKDLEGSILFIILVLSLSLLILGFLYFLNPALLQNIWNYLKSINFDFAVAFFKQSSIYLLIPLVLDLAVISLVSLIIRGSRH